jgi:hypothetical protein
LLIKQIVSIGGFSAALSKQALLEDQGFYLFDDLFVKSDPVRLYIQITTLWELVQNGWQVIYFSTKIEVGETCWQKNEIYDHDEQSFFRFPNLAWVRRYWCVTTPSAPNTYEGAFLKIFAIWVDGLE